ncbi:MAG: hypothetical protein PHI12_11050 [Dehalococcoidales bacterium]|nr:hypothetical protein [Dehalococcoidales bacterium]
MIYEEYETDWYRRIGTHEELEREKAIRDARGYGFFRLIECERDHGEICHIGDLSGDRPD